MSETNIDFSRVLKSLLRKSKASNSFPIIDFDGFQQLKGISKLYFTVFSNEMGNVGDKKAKNFR